jgi:acetyltransferase-like isoleucine patch superfamily enzyme
MSIGTADLLILGVGPHALEVFDIAERVNRGSAIWNVVGFAVASGESTGGSVRGLPVLSWIDAQSRFPEARLIPEFEWPRKGELPKDRLATLIDPSVFVASTAQVGRGCVIYPNCFIGAHARIGDLLFSLANTVVNHNDIIEDGVTLTSGVMLAGDVHVESDCYLGQGCTVREMLTIGRGSLIGMGAVVRHNVPPNSVMVGNPARQLRAREATNPVARAVRAVRRFMNRAPAALLRRAGRVRGRSLALMRAVRRMPS